MLRGLRHGGGLEARLVMAGFALIAGMALTVPITPNLVAVTFGAKMLRINHKYPHAFHP